jgi:hypothetical protein
MTKTRMMRWAGHIERVVENSNAYRVLVGTLEERKPLGRFRRRLTDNIKMDYTEIEWGDID